MSRKCIFQPPLCGVGCCVYFHAIVQHLEQCLEGSNMHVSGSNIHMSGRQFDVERMLRASCAASELSCRTVAVKLKLAFPIGRLGPGVCYRLWSEAAHAKLAEALPPEILSADLAVPCCQFPLSPGPVTPSGEQLSESASAVHASSPMRTRRR